MEWINIKDKLPEFNQGVLITDGEIVTAATRYKYRAHREDKYFWTGCGFGGYEWEWDFDDESVTHWMPLPEPPKETK